MKERASTTASTTVSNKSNKMTIGRESTGVRAARIAYSCMSRTSPRRAVLKHFRQHTAQTRLQLTWWERFVKGIYGTLCEQVGTLPCARKPLFTALANHAAFSPYWLAEAIDA